MNNHNPHPSAPPQQQQQQLRNGHGGGKKKPQNGSTGYATAADPEELRVATIAALSQDIKGKHSYKTLYLYSLIIAHSKILSFHINSSLIPSL